MSPASAADWRLAAMSLAGDVVMIDSDSVVRTKETVSFWQYHVLNVPISDANFLKERVTVWCDEKAFRSEQLVAYQTDEKVVFTREKPDVRKFAPPDSFIDGIIESVCKPSFPSDSGEEIDKPLEFAKIMQKLWAQEKQKNN